MEYLTAAMDFLFGCHHCHLSRVFTIGGRSYKVCCDCGAEFTYSLDTMSIERREFRRLAAAQQPGVGVRNIQHRVWPDAA